MGGSSQRSIAPRQEVEEKVVRQIRRVVRRYESLEVGYALERHLPGCSPGERSICRHGLNRLTYSV